jgi:hypothetical protein
LGSVNRPTVTTLPGFVARVWRHRLEPPWMVRPDGSSDFFVRPPRKDETVGCIAVTDAGNRAIGTLVPSHVRIVIDP